jgi:microcompartment protein CcmL/EutN
MAARPMSPHDTVSGDVQRPPAGPALALLEFRTVAAGIRAADAMVKRAPLDTVHAGTVQPGHFLVLVSGEVACVEEAVLAGGESGSHTLVGSILLPQVHHDVVRALVGTRDFGRVEALGIVETWTAATILGAADAGVKAADVDLVELRLADGLHGKGYALFGGALADVEAAVEHAVASVQPPDMLVDCMVIPQIHGEMLANLAGGARFTPLVRATSGAGTSDNAASPGASAGVGSGAGSDAGTRAASGTKG